MNEGVVRAVERITGSPVVAQRPAAAGGYTNAIRAIVQLADGRSVFVKAAGDDATLGWLRDEHAVYEAVTGPFMPDLLGWEDGILVLEDLSAAHWPPPWSERHIDAVRHALADLHALSPPAGLPSAGDVESLRDGWVVVASYPAPFLALGLCTATWLEHSLPTLIEAAERAPLDGDRIVHLDVRSDNLCLADGRCKLVDWNHTARGNPDLDIALWLPSLHLEGGPEPAGHPELAAAFAGFLACRAGLPEPPTAPPHGVRPVQIAQLRVALPWAARELGLSRPRPR